ncbi:Uncharacterized protein FKW44_008182 [Caligus rogercresseyi]|uniref:Uncharacterized protein n=1 Tax=Caligus rogercresseyi TaxID=217165 RepID=A0A7T8KFT5_CALRO|nr:Uncharacterized protein FKW44_008182 [Caligus rogercresseyi]
MFGRGLRVIGRWDWKGFLSGVGGEVGVNGNGVGGREELGSTIEGGASGESAVGLESTGSILLGGEGDLGLNGGSDLGEGDGDILGEVSGRRLESVLVGDPVDDVGLTIITNVLVGSLHDDSGVFSNNNGGAGGLLSDSVLGLEELENVVGLGEDGNNGGSGGGGSTEGSAEGSGDGSEGRCLSNNTVAGEGLVTTESDETGIDDESRAQKNSAQNL